MAEQKLGGYLMELDDDLMDERYSAELSLYVGGMMAFAYPDARMPVRDELVLLESVARDLQRLIEQKRIAVEKLNARKAKKDAAAAI